MCPREIYDHMYINKGIVNSYFMHENNYFMHENIVFIFEHIIHDKFFT